MQLDCIRKTLSEANADLGAHPRGATLILLRLRTVTLLSLPAVEELLDLLAHFVDGFLQQGQCSLSIAHILVPSLPRLSLSPCLDCHLFVNADLRVSRLTCSLDAVHDHHISGCPFHAHVAEANHAAELGFADAFRADHPRDI